MTLDTFITKYMGKTIGYPDGQYVGECLSLAKVYIKECFGFDPPPSGSNSAYGYWSNFPNPLPKYFTKVSNTPDGVPKRGDLVIWNTNAGGGYGHIAIFLEGTASSFKSLDQNWNGRQTHEQGHYYTNVVGWLTPIMPGNTYTEEQMTKVRLERDKNWDLYQTEKADHEATKAELAEEKQSNAQFIQTLASKLTTIADEGAIVGAVERLLAVEDQLLKCRKDYTQLEKEKFMLEADKNREIAKLKAEVDAVGEQLEQQQAENTRLATQVKQLSERIDDLLDQPKPQKPISGNPTGLQKLLNSIISVVRRLLWLEK